MTTLKETLLQLRSKVDQVSALKQSSPETPFSRENYQEEILPLLIALRGINRREKLGLEALNEKKKDYYQRLVDIQQQCECIEFEASCLKSDVDNISQGLNADCTIKNGLDVDHATRMNLLDAEENRRRDLQNRLHQLTEETKEVEMMHSKKSSQLNEIKPYIKSLLDKVDSTL